MAELVLHQPAERIAERVDVVDPEDITPHRIDRDDVAGIGDHVGDDQAGNSEGRVEVGADDTDGSEEALSTQVWLVSICDSPFVKRLAHLA